MTHDEEKQVNMPDLLPIPDAIVRAASIAAFPGLPEGMSLEEADRRVAAALRAAWPLIEEHVSVRRDRLQTSPTSAELPTFQWGESLTGTNGRILVPLNQNGETVADLELGPDSADTLAAMLADAAGPDEPQDHGPKTVCAGVWMDGIIPPDQARTTARDHHTDFRDHAQRSLDELDRGAPVEYWRNGEKLQPASAP